MSVIESLGLFVATISMIYVAMERLEKLSSKDDLETYYLLMTLKRPPVGGLWQSSLLRFFDVLFRSRESSAKMIVPSWSCVVILTGVIHVLVYFAYARTALVSVIGSRIGFISALVSFVTSILFDFLSFTKTRALLVVATNSSYRFMWMLVPALDFILSVTIAMIAFVVFLTFYFRGVISLFIKFPMLSNDIFSTDWKIAVSAMTTDATVYVNAIAQALSATISNFIVLTFAGSIALTRAFSRLETGQKLLERHTSVEEKPLQVLAAIIDMSIAACFGIYMILRLIVYVL